MTTRMVPPCFTLRRLKRIILVVNVHGEGSKGNTAEADGATGRDGSWAQSVDEDTNFGIETTTNGCVRNIRKDDMGRLKGTYANAYGKLWDLPSYCKGRHLELCHICLHICI